MEKKIGKRAYTEKKSLVDFSKYFLIFFVLQVMEVYPLFMKKKISILMNTGRG
jgi:hypothetical protein